MLRCFCAYATITTQFPAGINDEALLKFFFFFLWGGGREEYEEEKEEDGVPITRAYQIDQIDQQVLINLKTQKKTPHTNTNAKRI